MTLGCFILVHFVSKPANLNLQFDKSRAQFQEKGLNFTKTKFDLSNLRIYFHIKFLPDINFVAWIL